jgi:serine/threonine protein kinase
LGIPQKRAPLDLRSQLEHSLAGAYTIERELGRGGMATVYLARDNKHHRQVALKVLHPDLSHVLGAERFLREITLSAVLQHPHILTVLDSGDAGGLLWFTMPFVEGESLRDRLNRERQLPLEDALRIAREAADALDYAHRHGIVHRDIKPENILLTESHALVADFGIGKALGGSEGHLTETGLVMGTAAYMSPEQATGEKEVGARSDIYSLGTVLYEMLAGETPFDAPTAQAMPPPRGSGGRAARRGARHRQGALPAPGRPLRDRCRVCPRAVPDGDHSDIIARERRSSSAPAPDPGALCHAGPRRDDRAGRAVRVAGQAGKPR